MREHVLPSKTSSESDDPALQGPGGDEGDANGEQWLMGTGFVWGGDENVPKLIVVMAAQSCEHERNTASYTSSGNCMVYEIHPNTLPETWKH